jgi:hypothetical protein
MGSTTEELCEPRCSVGVHFLQETTEEACAMPSCRSPRAFLNAFDLTALHHLASGNDSMVRPEHLNTLVGMGLVVDMNGRTALTVEGLHALNKEQDAQRMDDR